MQDKEEEEVVLVAQEEELLVVQGARQVVVLWFRGHRMPSRLCHRLLSALTIDR
jgi:hypothetical protein